MHSPEVSPARLDPAAVTVGGGRAVRSVAVTPEQLVAAARAWRDEDPDPATRAEVDQLLATDDIDALGDRFAGRLEFGTAGLRGELGAGPNRMNRSVVIRATAGLTAYLADQGLVGVPVIVGYDARHRSSDFAADAAAVFAAAGHPVHLGDRPLPTPVVAFGVRHYGCAAGVQITASHNPPSDNGYKVYLGDGAQIAPPADRDIAARIDTVGPLASVALAPPADRRVTRVGKDLIDAYVDGVLHSTPGSRASRSTGPRQVVANDTNESATAVARADGPDAAVPLGATMDAPGGRGAGRRGGALGRPRDMGSAFRPVRVVYTPLHGVGRDVLVTVLTRAGFLSPEVVPAQAEPDPDFPTVAFPNPEEPGALDLALDLAQRVDADVILANDPDADRLAVAVPLPSSSGSGRPAEPWAQAHADGSRAPMPDPMAPGGEARPEQSGGGWRALSGDEIGVLLADWLLAQGEGADRLVVTTVVSSSMVSRLAAARGVEFAETLTGFKWIARAAADRPHLRFVYGYEEALGSCVGTLVRDKDGISAALAFGELVATEQARGRTVTDRLDDLARELGVHATGQRSVRIEGAGGQERMAAMVDRVVDTPPPALAGHPVAEVEDLRRGERLPPTDGVVLRGEGVRLIVRPSGTEPKLKCYAEAVVPVTRDTDLATARAEGAASVAALLDEASALTSH